MSCSYLLTLRHLVPWTSLQSLSLSSSITFRTKHPLLSPTSCQSSWNNCKTLCIFSYIFTLYLYRSISSNCCSCTPTSVCPPTSQTLNGYLSLRLSTLLSELLLQLTLSALCLTSDLTASCHLAHPTYSYLSDHHTYHWACLPTSQSHTLQNLRIPISHYCLSLCPALNP
jgi:hypothetical protein